MGKIKCPRCGKANKSDVIYCAKCALPLREESVQTQAPELSGEVPAAEGLALAPGATPKKKTGLVVGVAVGVLALAATGVAAVLLLRQPKTLGVTPEEIEGWIRDAAAEGDETADIVCSFWDLAEGIDIEYVDTNDKNLTNFRFYSAGFNVIGVADAKSHEMMQVVVEGDLYDYYELLADDYSPSVLRLAAQVADKEVFTILVQNLFGLSQSKAEDVTDGSADGEELEKNGTTYYIKGYTDDGDMTFLITTFEDEDELLDYINELTE